MEDTPLIKPSMVVRSLAVKARSLDSLGCLQRHSRPGELPSPGPQAPRPHPRRRSASLHSPGRKASVFATRRASSFAHLAPKRPRPWRFTAVGGSASSASASRRLGADARGAPSGRSAAAAASPVHTHTHTHTHQLYCFQTKAGILLRVRIHSAEAYIRAYCPAQARARGPVETLYSRLCSSGPRIWTVAGEPSRSRDDPP